MYRILLKGYNTYFQCEMNVGMVDIHTLYIWPCHLLLHIYDTYAASLSFYVSQIRDLPFYYTLSFEHFDLDI